MNTYVVHLTVHVGEYEKTYEIVVGAKDEDNACYLVLHGETHNTDQAPTFEDWQANPSAQWWDDDMVYTASVHKKLDPNQVNAITGIVTIH